MKVQFEQLFIYELNTRIFCKENSCTLDTFPEKFFLSKEFQACDYLWLMGIWMPSQKSKAICDTHEGLQKEFHKALPDLTNSDIVGSPYAIYLYEPNPLVAASFEEIKRFREKIHTFGKKLILDFVPNHLAVDTPLISENPNYFLQGDNLSYSHNFFLHSNGKYFAHGRDPYFDGWTDTIQWDFSNPDVLELHISIIQKISDVSDGVRCDMAMLPEEKIFQKTHGKRALPYWKPLIEKIKSKQKDFLFIAEVYWGMEYELQLKGFDFTYDKELYDRMKTHTLEIYSHLQADLSYQRHSLRFIENHDEIRAMEAFGGKSIHFFGVLAFLQGIVLYHDGQTTGKFKKLPVQLGRRDKEEIPLQIQNFYNRALDAIVFRKNRIHYIEKCTVFSYCEIEFSNTVAYCLLEKKELNPKVELLIYNPYNTQIKGRFNLPTIVHSYIELHKTDEVQLTDIVDGQVYMKRKTELRENDVFFELRENQTHWFVMNL
ncbi:MAG: alpha-amylase [Leptospiraceae bacterium]|nr:alpha-amylase [Leptospiraceae bacterium]MCK6379956.1 alpha-amylase [Leptospiraceae bacterium]NUM40084.1 alpha-amylase [Leptospiraceae bacterium]